MVSVYFELLDAMAVGNFLHVFDEKLLFFAVYQWLPHLMINCEKINFQIGKGCYMFTICLE